MKRGQLGRADLWATLASGNPDASSALSEALGLNYKPKPDENDVKVTQLQAQPEQQQGKEDEQLRKSPTAQLTSRYWQLIKHKTLGDRDNNDEQKKKPLNRDVWRNKPETIPAYPALMPLKEIHARLIPELNKASHTRQQIDLPRLINKISRAELPKKIPKTARPQGLQALQIIDDRQMHLTPYWLDHALLTLHLYDEFASYQMSRAVIQNGESQPQIIADQADQLFDLQAYQLPPANTAVLILSDLGRLSSNAHGSFEHFNQRQKNYWALLQQFFQNGNQVIALTPCHPKDYPPRLQKQIKLIPWESQTKNLPERVATYARDPDQKTSIREKAQDNTLEGMVNLLLSVAAPCIRLEPELLRSLRLGLSRFGYKIPSAAEARVWQHPSIKEPHNIAATFDFNKRKKLKELFIALEPDLQAFALQTIKNWRARLNPEIWFVELLDVEVSIPLPDELRPDIEDACNFYQQIIDEDKFAGQQGEAYLDWFSNIDPFLSREAVQKGSARRALQSGFAKLNPYSTSTPAGHVIDPDLLPPVSNKKEKLWLCQQGNQLAISWMFNPSEIPRQNSSVIAPIVRRNDQLKLELQNGEDKTVYMRGDTASDVLTVENTRNIPVDGELVIKTDHTELILKAIEKPQWASAIGRDAYGLHAGVSLTNKNAKTVMQRFRWIPTGEFMMGSPPDELKRFDDEDYHRVSLSQGYWLADTTVTQSLWLAFTGNNPAKFKGDLNPVENISWDDAQTFIAKLNKQMGASLGGLILRLPTEAEWEHACRAGTQTPFSFGKNITPEQVNYNGDYPYADAEKGINRRKTVAVKSLPANPWGLYEMHGNVWEWCADSWQEHLGGEALADPYVDAASKSVDRVVRGGSWISGGRRVRSAYRGRSAPGDRSFILGFRLSLGHELQSR